MTAVVAYARAGNTASLRVLEKLGLGPVGEVLLPGASEPIMKLIRLKEHCGIPGKQETYTPRGFA